MVPDKTEAEKRFDELPTVADAGFFFDTETYARFIGADVASVRRFCRKGEVKAVKVGREWRIPVEWARKQLFCEED